MALSVSGKDAQAMLLWAFENNERCPLDGVNKNICKNIETILHGSHKTYKYILITQLLAKSVNEQINALAIQSGAPLEGAFDARSLCHKVIVPFERKFLHNALGGSNEPFLNKPARCTHLDVKNPVRGGLDRTYLEKLLEILTHIDSNLAKKYLCFSISLLINISHTDNDIHKNIIQTFSNTLELYHLMRKLLEKSCEGEICVLLVGTIEKIFYLPFGDNYRIVVHNTNESGASSKEIGDIDIFYDEKYYYSIEVKDKNFTAEDLDFALNKMFVANAASGGFIYGPRAKFDMNSISPCLEAYDREKFIVIFENIFSYLKHMLMTITNIDTLIFQSKLSETAAEMNIKEITRRWVQEVFSK